MRPRRAVGVLRLVPWVAVIAMTSVRDPGFVLRGQGGRVRGVWRQVVLVAVGLLATLAVCVVTGVAGFRWAMAVIGPQVVNNFVVAPVVLPVAVLVGLACAALGVAVVSALFLLFGLGRHVSRRPGVVPPAASTDNADGPGVLGAGWSPDG